LFTLSVDVKIHWWQRGFTDREFLTAFAISSV
jgi:hypothetical protein